MSYRLAFLLLPPFVVLAAAGWLHPWQRWRGRAVAIGLLLIFLQIGWLYAQFNSPELRTDSIRRLAQDLEALAGAGDAIVVRDAAMALALFRYYDGRAEWDTVPGDGRTMSGGRVWIVRTLDEEDGSAQAGSNSAEAVGPFLGAVRYEGLWQSVELAAYAPEPSIAGIPTEATPAGADWSGELMLAGYRLPEQAQSGGIWQPAFYWRKGAAAAGQYTLFLRLVDAAGRTWSLQEWLLWEDYPPGLWPEDTVMVYQPLLRLPVGLPPGQYEASLQVARTENGQILPLNSGGNEFPLTLRAAIAPATAPDGLAHLPNFQSVNARFGRELRLLGYERAAVESYRPGHTIPIALLWQAENAPSRDYRLRLQLLDAAGRVLQEVVDPLVREDYPTSQWPPGVLLVGRHELLIPAQAAGRQQITAALLPLSDASTLEAEPVDAGGWFSDDIIRLGDVYVEPWPMETTLPDIESPLEAVFGAKGEIMLHGYALSPAGVVPGESLEVTLYWQAGDLIAENWQVFVHLLDGQGNVVAQRDGTPMNGFRPTASWRAGETFADVHTVQFPAALSNGPFTLWVGFYDPATGVRLPVRVAGELQANERLRLQEVESVR